MSSSSGLGALRLATHVQAWKDSSLHSPHVTLQRTDSQGLDVVRDIDVESGVHLLIRVIRRRIFYHRDLVAELSGKANGRFDAGMCDESDDYELTDAVLLELQIQICMGEATGTPMLRGNNLAWLRLEIGTDLIRFCNSPDAVPYLA